MKSQFVPFDIAVIALVLFVGLMFLAFVPTHLIVRNLAITTKITYTSNEADLTLLTLFSVRYKGKTLYSIFSLTPSKIETEDFQRFFTFTLNKTLVYKLKCYKLVVDKQKIEFGSCPSYDYQVTYPIFKPYQPSKVIEKISLAYQKVSK